MKTISQLKREASASLDGRWGKYAGVSLVYTLIAIAIVAIIIDGSNDSRRRCVR